MALDITASNASIDEARSIGGRAQFCYTISFDGDPAYVAGADGSENFQQFVRDLLEQEGAGGMITITDVNYHDSGGFTPRWTGPSTDSLKVYRTGAVNAAQEEHPSADLSATRFVLTIHGT